MMGMGRIRKYQNYSKCWWRFIKGGVLGIGLCFGLITMWGVVEVGANFRIFNFNYVL
jgi:hypothetical protein